MVFATFTDLVLRWREGGETAFSGISGLAFKRLPECAWPPPGERGRWGELVIQTFDPAVLTVRDHALASLSLLIVSRRAGSAVCERRRVEMADVEVLPQAERTIYKAVIVARKAHVLGLAVFAPGSDVSPVKVTELEPELGGFPRCT
jgi:hypothetical protein